MECYAWWLFLGEPIKALLDAHHRPFLDCDACSVLGVILIVTHAGNPVASFASHLFFPLINPLCCPQSLSHVRLCDPVDCRPPGSSVHWSLQARTLEGVAMPSSRGSSQPRGWTQVCRIAGGFFASWAIREAPSLEVFVAQLRLCTIFVITQFKQFSELL